MTNFRFLTDQVLPPVVSIVQQTGQLLLSTLVPAAQQTGAVMRGILGESLGWLAATVWPPLLSVVQQTSDLFTREILPTLPGVAAALRTTLGETVQWLASEVWPRLTAAAGAAWRFISGTIAPAIPELARSLRSVLGGALEWIGTTGWPLLERGAQAVVTAFEGIRGRVGPIVEQALNGDIAGAIRNLGSAFSEVAGLAAGWIGEQVARIDWASVWGRAVNVVGGMAAWFGALAGQLATWIGEQVAAVDWASVWNRAVDAVGAMVTWFADLGARLLTWVGDQVAAVDWSAVWARAVEVVAGMAQWFTTVASVFATWLGEQVGRIQWPSVWSNVTGMAEAMQAAFEREAAKLDWKAITQANKDMARQLAEGINEMIRAVDWTVVGQELAANMFREGGGVEQAMRAGWKLLRAPLVLIEPLVEFIKTADWGAVAQAFADVVAGFIEEGFRRAWATIRPLLPSWLDPLPRPPGGAMPFPVAPGSGLAPSTPGRSSAGGNVMSEPIDNSSRSSFVRTAYPYALAAAGGDPNLAEMMLAAAISENGDVGQGGGFIGNNFFGIKGSGPAGSFDADTWEWENGQRVPQRATFAAYSTPQEGLGGFLQFLQQNPRYSDALQQFQQTGDVDALFAGINRAGYATDPAWASTITNIRQNQVAPIASTLRATAPQAGLPSVRALNQFELGMPWADAQAACGPAALMTFWAATGRTPDPEEALQLARQSGWDRAGGMNGVGNFMDMLGRAGVSAALDATPTEAEIQASLAAGRPVAISTAGHYFTATGYDPLTGQYNVGGSGEALTGGSALMTMQEIIALTGPLNGAITLLDQVAPAALGAAAGVAPLGQGMAGLTAQTIDTSGAVGQVSEADRKSVV